MSRVGDTLSLVQLMAEKELNLVNKDQVTVSLHAWGYRKLSTLRRHSFFGYSSDYLE